MLLAALDENNQILNFHLCSKGRDYLCPECRGPVRLRSGPHQREHFYHYKGSLCKWSGITQNHLLAQSWMASKNFPQTKLEYWFRSIGRIADVFMPQEGIVVEIQCSPIQIQEVIQRTLDYQSLGLDIIWLLDWERFSAGPWNCEEALQHIPHYYLQFSENGQDPTLYDYVAEHLHPFEFTYIWRNSQNMIALPNSPKNLMNLFLWKRLQRWTVGLQGDLITHT